MDRIKIMKFAKGIHSGTWRNYLNYLLTFVNPAVASFKYMIYESKCSRI